MVGGAPVERGACAMTIPSDLEIARSVVPLPITEIARELGIRDDKLELYGPVKAKVSLDGVARLEAANPRGKYVVVTAITPTPLGEGKTTVAVGVAQGLNRIGKRAAVTIRQPSLGPVFGIKGGAAGGGYSQVLPMDELNLHLTGDTHAVGAAHNLAAASSTTTCPTATSSRSIPGPCSGRASWTSATARCGARSSA